MKKALVLISIFLVFLILFFIQANFFNYFTIAGIKPNLFIILVLFLGLYLGKYYGFGIGVILGLMLDIFLGKTIGINAIALGIGGFIGGEFTKNFSKESRMTIMLMLIGTTFICELISYVLQLILFKMPINFWPFIKIISIEIIYNIIIIIIIYPILQFGGNLIERIFKENKAKTKYF